MFVLHVRFTNMSHSGNSGLSLPVSLFAWLNQTSVLYVSIHVSKSSHYFYQEGARSLISDFNSQQTQSNVTSPDTHEFKDVFFFLAVSMLLRHLQITDESVACDSNVSGAGQLSRVSLSCSPSAVKPS
jgi:hypothetical protein